LEKGRAFIGVHDIDRAVGSGPNAFLVEMASGNGRIEGTEVLQGRFWRRRQRGERERESGHEGGMGALGKNTPTPCIIPFLKPP
jgi:hypothetical protein